ncbi:MAG TPA: ABC transporter permease subunit [Chloroflexota bacterium]|nr:ABC transporter permease subunit [Chloroflexota bacterium]
MTAGMQTVTGFRSRPPVRSQIRVLTTHLLRGQVVSIFVWGLALGAYNVLVVLSYPAFKNNIAQELSHLPPSARALFGVQGNGATIESWLAINTFNLIAPLALAFFPMVIGARSVAGREERQGMDLLLGNPLPRWVLVVSSGLTVGIGLLGILVPFGLLTWWSTILIGVHLPIARAGAAVLNLWPLCLWFGTLALLCSSLVRRSSLAIAIPGAVLLAMYVGEALGSTNPGVRFLRSVSLFHYYGSAIEHGMPWVSFLGISLLAVALAVLAALAFALRDVYT